MGGAAFAAAFPLLGGCRAFRGCHAHRSRVAVQLYSIREYIKANGLGKALAEVAKIGYEGVEFAGYWGYKAPDLKKMLDDNGLVACGTHINKDQIGEDKISRTIEFNLAYGNRYLVVPGGLGDPKQAVEFFAKAAEKAAAAGCKIGYHNHAGEHQQKVEGTGETVWEYFFANTPKSVCMEQDVGWTVNAGVDPCVFYSKFPNRSPTLHAKENDMGAKAGSSNGALGNPGVNKDGSARKGVDWDRLFKATDADRVGWYVVECETNPKTLAAIADSFAFLKAKGRC